MMLSEFDITYVGQKSIKGQAIAYLLASQHVDSAEHFQFSFPNESILFLEA